MKKKFFQLILFAPVLMTASTVFAAKETPEQLRAKSDDMSGQVLNRMYQKYPSAERALLFISPIKRRETNLFPAISNSAAKFRRRQATE